MTGRLLKLPASPRLLREADLKQYAPLAGDLLLKPVAAAAYALALWRFAADLHWSGEFFIDEGLFSKWQVWLAIGVAAQAGLHHMNRIRRGDDVSPAS